MADYVSILDKAVSGLSDNSPETRAVIYEKARAAIERKLRAMDPVPAESAIARQLEQLEAAISDVEGRYHLPVAEEPNLEPAPPAVPELPAEPAASIPAEMHSIAEPEAPADIRLPEGFVDEPILIDGIGEKTARLLAEQGVTRISQIAAMSDAQLADLAAAIGYPGFEITQEWKRQSLDMLSGQLPRGKTNQDRLAKFIGGAETQVPMPDAEQAPPPHEPPVAGPSAIQAEEQAVEAAIPETFPGQIPASTTPHDADYQAFLEAFARTEKKQEIPVAVAPAPEPGSLPDLPEADAPRESFRPKVPDFDEPAMPEPMVHANQFAREVPDTGSVIPSREPVAHGSMPAPAQDQVQPSISSSPDFVSQLDNDPLVDPMPVQVRPNRDTRASHRPIPPVRQKSGNAGTLAATGIMVLLLGAVGAGAYMYREPIMDLAQKSVVAVRGLLDVEPPAENPPVSNNSQQVEPQPTDEPAKDTSRLGAAESAVEPAPVAIETVEPKPVAPEQAEPTEPTVEPAAPATVEVQEEPAEETATNVPADTGTGGQPAAEPNANEQETLEQAVSGETAVLSGEKSYLYEEAAGSTGASRDEGNMSWSLVSEPPEEGSPAEPVIKGVMDIPGRGLVLNLSIKRNVDPALPASHLIELIFTAPAEFSGGNVDNISRFVMKASEQARGESLVGVPARIDTGYFLIALNNLDQALKTNLNLLENGDWVDIPVAYVTGRRALITFEKGASGKEVFAQALADWKNR